MQRHCKGLACLGKGTGCSHQAARGLKREKVFEEKLLMGLKESFEDRNQFL